MIVNGPLFEEETPGGKQVITLEKPSGPLGIIRVCETPVYLGHVFYEQELPFHCPLKTYLSAMENENEFLLLCKCRWQICLG